MTLGAVWMAARNNKSQSRITKTSPFHPWILILIRIRKSWANREREKKKLTQTRVTICHCYNVRNERQLPPCERKWLSLQIITHIPRFIIFIRQIITYRCGTLCTIRINGGIIFIFLFLITFCILYLQNLCPQRG